MNSYLSVFSAMGTTQILYQIWLHGCGTTVCTCLQMLNKTKSELTDLTSSFFPLTQNSNLSNETFFFFSKRNALMQPFLWTELKFLETALPKLSYLHIKRKTLPLTSPTMPANRVMKQGVDTFLTFPQYILELKKPFIFPASPIFFFHSLFKCNISEFPSPWKTMKQI